MGLDSVNALGFCSFELLMACFYFRELDFFEGLGFGRDSWLLMMELRLDFRSAAFSSNSICSSSSELEG
jgi:hypothetical protein